MRPEGRALLVPVGSDDVFTAVRDAIADLELPLNRLEHRRHHVEELFSPDSAQNRHQPAEVAQ